jgi:hypothetical protein
MHGFMSGGKTMDEDMGHSAFHYHNDTIKKTDTASEALEEIEETLGCMFRYYYLWKTQNDQKERGINDLELGYLSAIEEHRRKHLETILTALNRMKAQEVDVEQLRPEAIQFGANCHKLSNEGFLYCDIFGGIKPAAASRVAANTFDWLADNGHLTPAKKIDWEGMKREVTELPNAYKIDSVHHGEIYADRCRTVDHIRKIMEAEDER